LRFIVYSGGSSSNLEALINLLVVMFD